MNAELQNNKIKSPVFSIRLPDDEYYYWVERVENSGLSTSQYFRRLLHNIRTRDSHPDGELIDEDHIMYLFNRILSELESLSILIPETTDSKSGLEQLLFKLDRILSMMHLAITNDHQD
jgi:protein involved in polysaccharide export with SLBB domain